MFLSRALSSVTAFSCVHLLLFPSTGYTCLVQVKVFPPLNAVSTEQSGVQTEWGERQFGIAL